MSITRVRESTLDTQPLFTATVISSSAGGGTITGSWTLGSGASLVASTVQSISGNTLSSSQVTTALGYTPYNSTNPSGFLTSINSTQVINALGYTPASSSVATTGALGALSITTASASGGGSLSYNSSTGVFTFTPPYLASYLTGITSLQVTNALGFTPYNNTNPNGYITVAALSGYATQTYVTTQGYLTSITSGQVTGALGYTPYNATNPNGYITGINSTAVTNALGYTPYNATNPNGYITGINSTAVTNALGYTPYNATNPSGYLSTAVTSLTGGGHISVNQSTGGVTLGSDATSSNSGGTIVARDGSGNFSAGTISATATSANYADLAEKYISDADYLPGTVLVFGGEKEVTISTISDDRRVAGVVSTNPAHLMNGGIDGVSVALQGRVPCRVYGLIYKGDLMVTSNIPGVARANNDAKMGTVIGKALENYQSTEVGTIEVVVGRL